MSKENPFAEPDEPPTGGPEPEPEPEPERSGKAFNYLNLRSSEPDIDPYKAGSDLDLDAGPYAHLITGLVKQSGSTGSEAWMHYIVCAVLILDGETLFSEDTEPDSEPDSMGFPENEG